MSYYAANLLTEIELAKGNTVNKINAFPEVDPMGHDHDSCRFHGDYSPNCGAIKVWYPYADGDRPTCLGALVEMGEVNPSATREAVTTEHGNYFPAW